MTAAFQTSETPRSGKGGFGERACPIPEGEQHRLGRFNFQLDEWRKRYFIALPFFFLIF